MGLAFSLFHLGSWEEDGLQDEAMPSPFPPCFLVKMLRNSQLAKRKESKVLRQPTNLIIKL